MHTTSDDRFAGYLGRLRILEVGSELTEYCGKLLAGLGADVVKVEPASGEMTRSYGPFLNDEPDPNRSLHFWHYNLGKRSVVCDLDTTDGRERFKVLARSADVVIDGRPNGYMDERGIGYEALRQDNSGLVFARISPFGDTGPWAQFQGSDLVHLALGGIVMNCGYDPEPDGSYDLSPVAPQMWHAYAIAGEMSSISILGALCYRLKTGRGQYLSTSVHDAVAKNTEQDMPNWIYLRLPHSRTTCRHSAPFIKGPALSMTKDGRYLLPYRTYAKRDNTTWLGTVAVLKRFGMESDIEDPRYQTKEGAALAVDRITDLTDKLVGSMMFSRDLWRVAQAEGQAWAPVRRPEENVADDHWQKRGTFIDVQHPELGTTYKYMGARWLSDQVEWQVGPRPPVLGEHSGDVVAEWSRPRPETVSRRTGGVSHQGTPRLSKHSKPFALSNVRVLDLGWMLASAGAGRFLAAMGAEVIKVEHHSRPDGMRTAKIGACPPGGRREREKAMGPLEVPNVSGLNRSGHFMELNSGKLGMSLDLKHPVGRKVLEALIRESDIVIEGFSPGTMKRLGLGYEELRKLRQDIIYIQQSGFGEVGTYGRARAYGPSAQAHIGLSEMSGFPEPFPPAGIGYSYLDWFAAYNMATAMLAALYRRDITGQGCYIDASQCEVGLYLTGTSILDHSANGRRWSRYGNRSPSKAAAPHGIYRTTGDDRWIAVGAFTDDHWQSLIEVLSVDRLAADERFATLASRLRHQDELDAEISAAIGSWDGYELMYALQAKRVPAGVCQTARDRYEDDPQLRHLEWLVELEQQDIGTWPVKELPTKFSETPSYIGGPFNRSGPSYGQDTDYVLTQVLKLDKTQVETLYSEGVV